MKKYCVGFIVGIIMACMIWVGYNSYAQGASRIKCINAGGGLFVIARRVDGIKTTSGSSVLYLNGAGISLTDAQRDNIVNGLNTWVDCQSP